MMLLEPWRDVPEGPRGRAVGDEAISFSDYEVPGILSGRVCNRLVGTEPARWSWK